MKVLELGEPVNREEVLISNETKRCGALEQVVGKNTWEASTHAAKHPPRPQLDFFGGIGTSSTRGEET